MSTSSITIKTPGKLMIAGEFAVLEEYHKLVVMAVDRFVYATLEQKDENRLSLRNLNLNNMEWTVENNKLTIKTDDQRVRFVEDAMTVVYTYLKEKKVQLSTFHLAVHSELDDRSGRKYGLGSSAAVVTSVVTAILKKFLSEEPSPKLIFKLAAIAHVKTQGSGSGADVAASSYGGWLEYASFQADWLLKKYNATSTLSELVEKNWPYFSVSPIKLPDHIYVCIGWTGNPASTAKLVKELRKLKIDSNLLYEQFLSDSKTAVTSFLKGIRTKNPLLIIEGVKQNRRALATVGENANVDIETPLLKTLCDLAEQYGGAGKPSGAGGGDCGIAFMPSKEKAQQLTKAWEKAGIRPLDIVMYPNGAGEI